LLRYFPANDALGEKIAAALTAEGISTSYRGSTAPPDNHIFGTMFPLFEKYANQCRPEFCPVASDLFNRTVSTHLDQWWTPEDADAVAAGINKVLRAFCNPAVKQS
jgi:hypothetical protein